MSFLHFLRRTYETLVRVQLAIGNYCTGLPFWKDVERYSLLVAGPIRGIAGLTLRILPFLRRAERYLEIESLRKRSPVILAVSVLFITFRGLMTSPNGHIGTDIAVFPFLTLVSGFNPFLGAICGIVFGFADLLQKLIHPDIYGAMKWTDPNYPGAMLGYLIAYSATVWMGLVPGVLSRVGRNIAISIFQKIRSRRAAAKADGATPAPQDGITEGVGLLGSIIGGFLGGFTGVRFVAPVLEKPAFYLRPNPDVSCYNSEVGTLKATSPNSGATGIAGGAIGATRPPTQPVDPETGEPGTGPPPLPGDQTEDPESIPVDSEIPGEEWVVKGSDGKDYTFSSRDEADAFVEAEIEREHVKQTQNDYKNTVEQIGFVTSIRNGLRRNGRDTSSHDREIERLKRQRDRLDNQLREKNATVDYTARKRSEWTPDPDLVELQRKHREKSKMLDDIHRASKAMRNLIDKGQLKSGEGQTDRLLDKLNQMSSDLVNKGSVPDRETMEKLRGMIKKEMDAQHSRDEAKRTNWIKEGTQATTREIFTGTTADGETSYKAMALRGLLGVATGGKSEYVLEVGEKMYIIRDEVMAGKSGMEAVTTSVTRVVTDELTGRVVEKGVNLGGGLLTTGYRKTLKGTQIGDALEKGIKKTGDVLNTDVKTLVRQGTDNAGDSVPVKVPEIRNLDDKIGKIRKNAVEVDGKPYADVDDVLELQRNPQGVRRLKNLETPETQAAFNNTLHEKVYKPHDLELEKSVRDTRIEELKAKYPDCEIEVDVKVDDFRTPGKPAHSINTDRDFRVLEDVTIRDADGNVVKTIKKTEVPKETWESKHHDIFAEKTGFDPSKCPDNLSTAEQKKWWAEKHGQAGTDKFHVEASRDYSDQVLDTSTGTRQVVDPSDITASKLKKIADDPLHGFKPGGETVKLEDPGGFGEMFREKVDIEVRRGNPYEAVAQAKKGVETLDKVRAAYVKQGLEVGKLPDNFTNAMELIEKSNLPVHPDPSDLARLNKDLGDLGFKGGLSDFSGKLGGQFESLKFAKPEKFGGELKFKNLNPEQMTARTLSRAITHEN